MDEIISIVDKSKIALYGFLNRNWMSFSRGLLSFSKRMDENLARVDEKVA
jgi:hypothetical protein